ncbi:MAG TPA: enoyl-CoA hydratase [Burkholderiales bacterium]|nr:enoyl-CoA hydratase [Burkholderiales bacterium]
MIRGELERRAGGTIARLTLDNPKKLNSFTREALRRLVETVASLETGNDLRAVVITGAGEKAFCGGADLEVLGSLDPAGARDYIGLVHAACAAMRECPVPVVARINGWCLGAGLELAAACDLRIAADHAMFGMPEVRLGIPSVVEAALLPRLCGPGRARWLVMTGETIDAREALNWGLIEKSVSANDLDKSIDHTVDSILAGGSEAMRAQKRLCKLWEEAPLEAAVRASIDEFAASYESDEPRRRVAELRRARRPRGR